MTFTAFLRTGLACLLPVMNALGQAGRAELFGTVHDPSNLVISGAAVEAQDQGTGASSRPEPMNAASSTSLLSFPATITSPSPKPVS